MKDFVEFEKAIVKRTDGDILVTTYKKAAIIDLIDAKELDAIYVTMAQGSEVFLLVDLTAPDADLSNEAQAYFSRRARIVPSIKAAAIVINTLRARIVARFYIQYFKPLYATKIFGSIEEAQIWFESVRKEELVS
ncbi:MAG: hypothetical protein HYZ14_04435 [Bacteroidetes bacterium]|nr:hypothetical protein [Bacteroidota bacterium]